MLMGFNSYLEPPLFCLVFFTLLVFLHTVTKCIQYEKWKSFLKNWSLVLLARRIFLLPFELVSAECEEFPSWEHGRVVKGSWRSLRETSHCGSTCLRKSERNSEKIEKRPKGRRKKNRKSWLRNRDFYLAVCLAKRFQSNYMDRQEYIGGTTKIHKILFFVPFNFSLYFSCRSLLFSSLFMVTLFLNYFSLSNFLKISPRIMNFVRFKMLTASPLIFIMLSRVLLNSSYSSIFAKLSRGLIMDVENRVNWNNWMVWNFRDAENHSMLFGYAFWMLRKIYHDNVMA